MVIKNKNIYKIMEYKGRVLKIYRDGRVLDGVSGEELNKVKVKGYDVVYVRGNDNEVKNFYVHRLLGEMYVPKGREEYDTIKFRDGNKENLSIDNLEWTTKGEIFKEYRNSNEYVGNKNLELCKGCGDRYVRKDTERGLCVYCGRLQDTLDWRKSTVEEYMEGLEYVTSKQREVLLERKKGKTLQEIADELGITRQAVDMRIKGGMRRIERSGRKFGKEVLDKIK